MAPLANTPADAASLLPIAMPLLQLMARLRTMASQPDAADLRTRVDAELQRFTTRAEEANTPPDQLRRAHYALCASLDDLVLATPWGAASAWRGRTLVAALHANVGPDRFFDVLRQSEEKAIALRPVLELMYVCLSLGVLGRYRGTPGGAEAAEQARAQAGAALTAGHAAPGPLAARWEGVAAPFRPGRRPFPLWVVASLGLAVAGGAYLVLDIGLNDRSDALFARMLTAPPAHMPLVTRQPPATPPPPQPPPAEPSLQDRLRTRLAAAVADGRLMVAGTSTTPVLRLSDQVLFKDNAATVEPGAAPLLSAVAAALKPETGRLQVLGYTDDRPTHTVRFPSAYRLSAARATAVQAALAKAGLDARTMSAAGRAGADPVASNATPEGRAENRRTEIVLDQVNP